MKPTISSQIMEVLKKNRKWWMKQDLADYIHLRYKTTNESVGRIAREMASEGLIEVDYRPVPRVRALVMYRMKCKKV